MENERPVWIPIVRKASDPNFRFLTEVEPAGKFTEPKNNGFMRILRIGKCTLDCPGCEFGGTKDTTILEKCVHVDIREVEKEIREAAKMKYIISFRGGEAVLLRELGHLCRVAHKCGAQVHIETNGMKPAFFGVTLKDADFGTVLIKSLDQKESRKYTGCYVPETYIRNSIMSCAEHDALSEIKLIVRDESYEEISRINEFVFDPATQFITFERYSGDSFPCMQKAQFVSICNRFVLDYPEISCGLKLNGEYIALS